MEGVKHDSGKLRWDLLPIEIIEDVVKILTFGASKYTPENWKGVSIERYYAALMRHIVAWRKGEITDTESNVRHLAHAITNLIFIMWLEENREDD